MYFWTWNTQEVLDMIEWMRNWNSGAAANAQVQFLGFDMQYPGTAIDSVVSYLHRLNPPNEALAVDRYFCLEAYRNRGEVIPVGAAFYGGRTSDADKAKCARGLQEVADTLRAKRASLAAASSSDEYELRLHDARLVQQFEAMASVSADASAGSRARDKYMAENVQWIRDQAPPGARIVLWAHNGHVAVHGDRTMGAVLRAKYVFEQQMVVFGFAFNQGSFQAIPQAGGALKNFTVPPAKADTLDATLASAGISLFAIDLRQSPDWFRQPRGSREIGAVYPEGESYAYVADLVPATTFDALVFFDTTTVARKNPGR